MKEVHGGMGFRQNVGRIIGCFIILGLCVASPSRAQNVVLKIGTLAPEGSTWAKAFREVNKELEQKTNKQISLRLFPGGILGDEEDMLRKIKVGQINGALLTGGGLGLIFKDMKVMGIPFLFQNYQEVDALLARMDSFFQKGLLDNGFKSMGWTEQGFIYLLSKEPIRNATDLKKGKVWIWEDTALGKAVFKELGVNPVPLSIADVLMALQTGMVDTVYSSPLAAIAVQWFTKVSFMTDVPLAYSAGAVVIKKSDFEKIAPAQRGIVEEAFRRQLNPLKESLRKEDEKAIQVLQGKGIKLVTPSARDVKELQALCFKGVATLGEDHFSKKTLEEVRNFLKTLRKEN
jgi:TRAP-type C4-dicarboxylate transport system substrate-binding protein